MICFRVPQKMAMALVLPYSHLGLMTMDMVPPNSIFYLKKMKMCLHLQSAARLSGRVAGNLIPLSPP
jgi:hypothetical protein